MIKEYKSVVKAEVFDGSKEMASRYPIRYFPAKDWIKERWCLDIPTPFDEKYPYPANLLVGQYLVTRSDNTTVNMDPYDFESYFQEVSNG